MEKKQTQDRARNTEMQIALKNQAVTRLEKVLSDLQQRLDVEKGADDGQSHFFDMLPQKNPIEAFQTDTQTVSSHESPLSELPDAPL